MEHRPRHRLRLALLAGAILLAAAGLPRTEAGEGAPTERADGLAIMRGLSENFRELEVGLGGEDSPRVRAALAALSSAVPDMRRLADGGGASAPGMRTSVDQFDAVVDEIATLWADERTSGARQAFAELRATCVTCHAKYRHGNEERGVWPASGATINGRVRLFDVDGEPYGDSSSVLVFLERSAPQSYRDDRLAPRLHQRERTFEPRVLPVTVGTTVEFPNDDTIFHNVFSLSKTAPFDLGVYQPGDSRSVVMERTGLIKVHCNIHPEMAASVVVLREPWFAVTDEDGRFVIANIPSGSWQLRAWNDRGVDAARALELEPSAWRSIELELRETRRVLPHKNKFGKPYAEKY